MSCSDKKHQVPAKSKLLFSRHGFVPPKRSPTTVVVADVGTACDPPNTGDADEADVSKQPMDTE
jgi:hypothetical protein